MVKAIIFHDLLCARHHPKHYLSNHKDSQNVVIKKKTHYFLDEKIRLRDVM